MKNLSDENLLKTTKDLAAVGYTLKEIAEVIQVSESDLKEAIIDNENPFTKAYLTGKNELKFSVRVSLSDLAANGSMPATLKIIELLQIQETNERLD